MAVALNIHLSYDPEIPFMGIYSREAKLLFTQNCTQILIVVLVIITKSTQMSCNR